MEPVSSAYKQMTKLATSSKNEGYLTFSLPNLFELLSLSVQATGIAKISIYSKELFSLFLSIFNLREDVGDREENQDLISKLESKAISSFLNLVVKLNEKTFKPMFLVILEWVKIDSGLAEAIHAIQTKQSKKELIPRVLFFYQLIYRMTELLQGIFVPYFSYLIPHIVSTTSDLISSPHSHSIDTLHWIYHALKLCFQFDDCRFVTVSVFQKLLDPLMATVDWVYPNESSYKKRIEKDAVPCFVQLAINLNNEELLKPLNYQLLMKTRNEDENIKWASITLIHSFYVRLGQKFLPLLPESIQFIYELMEDTNSDIEEAVGKLRKTLEKLLGAESFADLLQ